MKKVISNSSGVIPSSPPALSPEARENQLISLAVDNAERMLRDGTAPVAVVTHYLKLASSREKLEQERLRMENELTKAKKEQIQNNEKMEELLNKAMVAFKRYSGSYEEEELDEEPEEYYD